MKIKLLGVMGSVPGGVSEFGSNTSCMLIYDNDSEIIFDSGTGILSHMSKTNKKEHFIIYSHYHFDHIIGLPYIKQLFSNHSFNLYGPTLGKITVQDGVEGLFKEPYLPVSKDEIKANLQFVNFKNDATLKINGFSVTSFLTSHPGGSMIYKIEKNNKKILYLCDLPNQMKDNHDFLEFCKNSDLIYADAMFVNADFKNVKLLEYGHASIETVIEIFNKTNCKQMYIGHHNVEREYESIKMYETENITISFEETEIKI